MTDELTPKQLIVLALNDAINDKQAKLNQFDKEMVEAHIGCGPDPKELVEEFDDIKIRLARTRAALDAARKLP